MYGRNALHRSRSSRFSLDLIKFMRQAPVVRGMLLFQKNASVNPKKIVVYEINYIKSLESDVQSLYITKLEFSKDLLLIKTENDGIFSCDITNGKVKTIKTPQGYRILKSNKTPVQLEKIWITKK